MIKLMIADDEAGIRGGLRHYMDWSTWDIQLVAEAADGDEAFRKAIQTQPDILLSDIRMPGRDGIQLARDLKEVLPGLRVILLTGYNETQYLQDALKIGVKDYLLKPAGAENIIESVLKVKEEILRERSRYQESVSKATLLDESIPILQMHFVNDLVGGRTGSREAALAKARQLGIPLDAPWLTPALLRLQETEVTAYKSGKELSMDFWQKTRAMGVVTEEFPGCFFSEIEPYAFLVLAGGSTPAVSQETARSLCGRLVEALRLQRQESTAGIGIPVSTPLDLPDSYVQALRALALSAWQEDETVFLPPPPPDPALLEEGTLWEQRSMEFFMDGRWDQGLAAFGEMFRCYRQAGADFDQVRDSCCKLLTVTAHLPACASWRESFDADLTLLRSMTGGQELQHWMSQRLSQMANGSPRPSAKGCSAIVAKAQEYIRAHYPEDITIQDIAHAVFISPNYLGRLFREQTGCKLGDWLNLYRVEQAKLLLSSTGLKTYEIASRVGFSSYKYFSVCFLKYTGCSAREYRAAQAPGEENP